MSVNMVPELPAEVVERIFRVGRPGGEPGEPLLSDKERFRCQLVCKAWWHALAASRWPLWRLGLAVRDYNPVDSDDEDFPEPPPAASWVQRVRPAVQRLHIELGGDEEGLMEDLYELLPFESAPVQAVHRALLSLHPLSALASLSLTAPFEALEHFAQDLGRFTGLRRLELQAMKGVRTDEPPHWYGNAVLTTALLRRLPPQLERLTAAGFAEVLLKEEEAAAAGSAAAAGRAAAAGGRRSAASAGRRGRAGRAAAAGSAAPSELLPGLTQLHIRDVETVELGVALPSLADLTTEKNLEISLAGKQLHLPQLTSLRLDTLDFGRGPCVVPLRCAAMPVLARLTADCPVAPCDSLAALQQLTHLDLCRVDGEHLEHVSPLLQGLAPSLRSLCLGVSCPFVGASAGNAAAAAAAAGMTQLTHLDFNSLACLPHLPAWPNLRELRLSARHIVLEREHLPLLAAAPALKRLAFPRYVEWADEAEQLMDELRQALPGCSVELN